MGLKIRIKHSDENATITIVATCDEGEYKQMYEAITTVLKTGERMKITVTEEEYSPCSITKNLKFVSPRSMKIFVDRLPKKR